MFVFNEKMIRTIIEIHPNKKTYISKLAKGLTTQSHLTSIIDLFKQHNIVDVEKVGRIKYLTLTQKGVEIRNYYIKINSLMKEDD